MSSGEITGRLEECSVHQAPTFSRLIEAEESRRPTRTYLADFIISHMVPAALDWREFAAGWGASFVNITITFPMNKLMFRQMLHGVDFQRAARMLKKEGLCRLYRGIAPPLFQKTLSVFEMSVEFKVRNFIDGQFTESEEYLDSYEPATGKVFAKIPDSDAGSVEAAVAAARRSFQKWSRLPVNKRADLMLKLADEIEANLDELALLESRDQGKPVWLAKAVDIPRAVTNFRLFAQAVPHQTEKSKHQEEFSALSFTEREAIGVCALISPWNLPLYLLTFKMAPALIAGNTVVCKPSEMTSLTAYKLCELIVRVGFPHGVVNMVFGTGPRVGSSLVEHPDVPVVSFTGSTATGKRIAIASAPLMKKLSLEMGGKNAGIIFGDVDLNEQGDNSLMKTLLKSCFINQGEVCLCTSRLYVHESIFDEFMERFVPAVKALKVGPSSAPGVFCGALISADHWKKVAGFVDLARKEGAAVHCGHGCEDLKLPDGYEQGYYFQPTVITGLDENSACVREEIFGPVVTVSAFKDEDEVIQKANAVTYGLCASLWSRDGSRCLRVSRALKVGTVWVNCWMVRCLDMPFGGVKASGRGREGIEESMDFYTEVKTVCVKY